MKRVILYIYLCVALVTVACNENAVEELPFDIVSSSLHIDANGGEGYIVLNKSDFQYECAASWCSIEKMGDSLVLVLPANPEISTRTARIVMYQAESQLAATIYQVGQNINLDNVPEAISCDYKGVVRRIAYSSNVEVEYVSDSEWVTVERGDGEIVVSVAENMEFEDRLANVKIWSGVKSSEIAISQTSRFKMDVEFLEFPRKGASIAVPLISADKFEVKVESPWCSCVYNERTRVLNITCAKYQSFERSRTNKVTITTSLGKTKTIDIVQRLNYDDYLGKWLMEFKWTDDYGTYDPVDCPDEWLHIDVEFKELERNKKIKMTGFFKSETNYFVLEYDDESGRLFIGPQRLGYYNATSSAWLALYGNEAHPDGSIKLSNGTVVPCGITFDSKYKMEMVFNNEKQLSLSVESCEKSHYPVYMNMLKIDPQTNRNYYEDCYGKDAHLYSWAKPFRMEIYQIAFEDGNRDREPHAAYMHHMAKGTIMCNMVYMLQKPIVFSRK